VAARLPSRINKWWLLPQAGCKDSASASHRSEHLLMRGLAQALLLRRAAAVVITRSPLGAASSRSAWVCAAATPPSRLQAARTPLRAISSMFCTRRCVCVSLPMAHDKVQPHHHHSRQQQLQAAAPVWHRRVLAPLLLLLLLRHRRACCALQHQQRLPSRHRGSDCQHLVVMV
jgi:hypothetical protein